MSVVKTVVVGDKTIKFEFNKFAKQANGSVMISCGDTQVLVTACASDEAKPGQDFFPLSVDYLEKFYAAGRIPGGFIKRETKPSDLEALTARVIDRPLRPSFPKDYLCDTHIVCTVVSVDPANPPSTLALIGASTALMISDIPFNGPVAALRVGRVDGKLVLDPKVGEEGDLDLNIAANPDAVLMVEANANFLSEEEILEAINFAHESMKPIFEMQLEIQKEIGKAKRDVVSPEINAELWEKVQAEGKGLVLEAITVKEKQARTVATKAAKKKLVELLTDGDEDRDSEIKGLFEKLVYTVTRSMILDEGKRIDGRSFTDIRPIACETAVLKKSHGSALFTRGETQSLASVTLGSAEDEQRADSILLKDYSKSFYLHYNFPPYSVGEARFMRGPGRREIGHGMLAEKSLAQVMPSQKEFGYTVRLVSEILESNGSSSMASVCAGTLALLDAGVPLKQPIAGIAMGLVSDGDNYAVLSDILGDEDHLGDMDFKVTGGQDGITALQMDIKISGLSKEIMTKALDQAKEGRRHILGLINDTISTPGELSEYAPRIFQMKIKEDKIRDLIGPGGKTIKKVIADCNVKVDIDDNGTVNIIAPDGDAAEKAKDMIRLITSNPEVGEIYMGRVTKVVDFGAFVEIKPGVEGLLHISQLDDKRVAKVTDVVNRDDEVMVKILEVDRQGKIKLSRKEALKEGKTQPEKGNEK